MPKVETFDRGLVLDQATEVFHKKGYNGSSMQDLVDATGLNRSSIYNSFGCKLDMFLEILKTYQDKNSRETSKLLLNSKNAVEAIDNIFDMYIREIIVDKHNKGCLLVNTKAELGLQESSIADLLYKNQDNVLTLFEDLIKDGQKSGIINTNKTSKHYASYLFSSLQGLRMTGILIKDEVELRSIVDTIKNSII